MTKAAEPLCADFYLLLKKCFSTITENLAGSFNLGKDWAGGQRGRSRWSSWAEPGAGSLAEELEWEADRGVQAFSKTGKARKQLTLGGPRRALGLLVFGMKPVTLDD